MCIKYESALNPLIKIPDDVQTFSVIANFQLECFDNLVSDVGGVVIVVVVEGDVVIIGVIGEV